MIRDYLRRAGALLLLAFCIDVCVLIMAPDAGATVRSAVFVVVNLFMAAGAIIGRPMP